MIEKPLVLHAPLIRAALEGRVTQLRIPCGPVIRTGTWQPGQLIWIRETWYPNHIDCADKIPRERPQDGPRYAEIVYRADGEFSDHFPEDFDGGRWSPSTHMPRWAARLGFAVTGATVRCEQARRASVTDMLAEGIHKRMRHASDEHDRWVLDPKTNDRQASPDVYTAYKAAFGLNPDEHTWVLAVEKRDIDLESVMGEARRFIAESATRREKDREEFERIYTLLRGVLRGLDPFWVEWRACGFERGFLAAFRGPRAQQRR